MEDGNSHVKGHEDHADANLILIQDKHEPAVQQSDEKVLTGT